MSRETDDLEVPRSFRRWQEVMGDEQVGKDRKALWAAVAMHVNDAGTCWPGPGALKGWAGKGDRQIQKDLEALDAEGFLARFVRQDPRGGRKSTFYVVLPDRMDDERLRVWLDDTAKHPAFPKDFSKADFLRVIDRLAPDERGAIFRTVVEGRFPKRTATTVPETNSEFAEPKEGTAKGTSPGTSSGTSPETPSPSNRRANQEKDLRKKEATQNGPPPQESPVGNPGETEPRSPTNDRREPSPNDVSEHRTIPINGVTPAEVGAQVAARRSRGVKSSPAEVRSVLEYRASAAARVAAGRKAVA